MATPFHLELVTPTRVLFSGEVEEISMRTDGGEIAFLAHHEDYVGAVAITVVRLTLASGEGSGTETTGQTELFAVHGGFVHVESEQVTILASIAEPAAEIDVDRAREALRNAEERFAAEGPATRPDTTEADGEPAAAQPLGGAMVALLAPDSGEAAVNRAKVRLEAAGVPVGS